MRITHIRLANEVALSGGTHSATVVLESESACLSVKANTENAAALGVRKALVDDALRQLRRMPEYRNGQRTVEFTRSAWNAIRSP